MSENINFSNNLTFTKVTDADTSIVTFDITDSDGLVINADGASTAVTMNGDVDILGNLNVTGDTIVNADTKLSLTDKNVFMNVPEEPMEPSGTSTLSGDTVVSAVVVNAGTGFAPNQVVAVVFEISAAITSATGTVTANGVGTVPAGTLVTITDGSTGYNTAPNFTFGDPVANKPARAAINADDAGTIVMRDWHDETSPHAGIIWNETDFAWDLNKGILQNIYLDVTSGSPVTLPSNPKIKNVGAGTDDDDAVIVSQLNALSLGDLSDVDGSTPSIGDILKYTGNGGSGGDDWEAGTIAFSDLTGITTPTTSSGYFYWNHTTSAFEFDAAIDAADVTGLHAIATSGNINDLNDVTITAVSDGEILVWSTDRWINRPKISAGDLDTIQSPSTSPTSIVSATGSNVLIDADNNVTLNTGALLDINVTTDVTIDSQNMTVTTANALKLANADTNGRLTADGDLILTSIGGEVIVGNVGYPVSQPSTPNGAVLTYDSAANAMVFDTLPQSATQPRIEDTLGTTYVDTTIQPDIVSMSAPDIGDPSDLGGTVTNTTGIVMDPGEGRDVVVTGSGVSLITSDTGMNIITTSGNITLSPTADLVLDGYIFPQDTDVRDAGDILMIDPSDTANRNSLIFDSLGLNNIGGVATTPILEKEVLIANTSGELVNRRIAYSDIDPLTIPSYTTNFLALTDTYDPTGSVPSVPDELRNKYVRWDINGTSLVYQETIQATSIDFNGVTTNVVPSANNTFSLGSASNKFSELHVTSITAGSITGNYDIPDGSITESKLDAGVVTKLNAANGDVLLAADQTFLGANTFSPTGSKTFTVSATDGDVQLTTATGDIQMSTVDGDVNISSSNGEVNINGYMRCMEVSFDHTAGNSVVNIGNPLPDNAIVTSVRALIATAFDGTNPLMEIGNLTTSDVLMESSESKLAVVGLDYKTTYNNMGTSANGKQLIATLNLGSSTVGSAKILIEYYVV